MRKLYPVHAWGCRQPCYPGKAAGARVPALSASLIAKSSVGDAKGIPCTVPSLDAHQWVVLEDLGATGLAGPTWLTPSAAAASHPLWAAVCPLSPSAFWGHMGTCWDASVPGEAKGRLLLPCPHLAPSLCGPPVRIG